jgi:hypothetical protein
VVNRLSRFASAVSLVLCVATCAAWVRSYWRWDQVDVAREWFESKRWTDRPVWVWSGRGGFNLGWTSVNTVEANVEWGEFPNRVGKWHFEHHASKEPSWPDLSDEVEPGHKKFGFAFGFTRGFTHASWRDGYRWEFVAPYIFPVLLLAVLPSLRIFNRLRYRRRQRPGLCVQCSYNLNGNTSGVCPECGTPVVLDAAIRAG